MYKRLILILVGTLSLRFYPFILGKTFFFGDNYSLIVPGKIFTAFWVRQGILPLWNPLLFGGVPFFGDINQSLFSISTIFFILLEPATALNLTIISYCLVSFLGMYFFAKKYFDSKYIGVFAATIWLFSSSMSNALNNISVLQSLAFVPWLLFFGVFLIHKRWGVIFTALVIVMMMLGGYPQLIPYAVLLGSIFSLQVAGIRKTHLINWIVAGLLSIGLSAFIWMPFISTLSQSTRTLQSALQSGNGDLNISDLSSLLLPTFFADPQSGMKWGPGWNEGMNAVPYISWFGLSAVLLVFLRKKQVRLDYIFVCIVLWSLLLSFGNLLRFLPILSASRGPQLALVMTEVVLSLWIPDLIVRLGPLSKKKVRILTAIILLFLILRWQVGHNFQSLWHTVDLRLGSRLSESTFHTPQKDRLIVNHAFTIAALHGLFLVTALYLWEKKQFWLLLIIVALEMQFSTSQSLFFAPNTIYPTWNQIESQQESAFERYLINNGNQPYTDFAAYWEALAVRQPFSNSYIDEKEMKYFTHLSRMRNHFTPNWFMVYGINSLNGYTAFIPRDVNARWNKAENDVAINSLPEVEAINPNLPFWGVSQILVDPFFPNAKNKLEIRLPANSRFRLSSGELISKENIVETPNWQKIHVNNVGKDVSLVIADRFDPGWRATNNNKPVLIENSDGMRRVKLESGDNLLELSYHPQNLTEGIAVSFATLLGAVWFVLANRHPNFEKN